MLFPPPSNPPLITNTDSGLTHALTMSGEASYDASVSSTDNEGSINSLNSDVFSFNYHFFYLPCFVFRRGYKSDNNINASNIRLLMNDFGAPILCIIIQDVLGVAGGLRS